MSLPSKFTPAQTEAIESKHTRIIVISPPGTGKTHVVTGRYLRDTAMYGADSVIAISFTRKAASEINERLTATGLITDPRFPASGTFHSVALMLLSLGQEKGLYDGPTNLAGEQTTELLLSRITAVQPTGDVVLHAQNKALSNSIREIVSALERVKRSGYMPVEGGYRFVNGETSSAVQGLPNPTCRLHARMVAYQNALASDGMLDYNDALIAATALIADTRRRQIILPNLKTIIVDEYQDSNPINEMMIRCLAHNITLMCCCDDDQSIYHWRGAKSDLVTNFTKVWKDSQQIVLDHNFRSPPSIRIIADNLMSSVPNRIPKTTIEERTSARDISKDVTVHMFDPRIPYDTRGLGVDSTLADYTAGVVASIIESGAKPEDVAVLSRSHAAIGELSKAFSRANIHYRASNPDRSTSAEINHLRAWLDILNGTNQLQAIATISRISTTNRGLRDYHEYALSQKIPLADFLLDRLENGRLRTENYRVPITAYGRLKKDLKTTPVAAVLEKLMQMILGTFEEHMTAERERVFWAAYHALLPVANLSPPGDFGAVLQRLTTAISDDTLLPQEGLVSLSTIHHMKGRQAPHIVICALADNIIPSNPAIRSGPKSDEMHEEMRLTYVAYTRTMKHLHIIGIEGAKSTFIDATFHGLDHPLARNATSRRDAA